MLGGWYGAVPDPYGPVEFALRLKDRDALAVGGWYGAVPDPYGALEFALRLNDSEALVVGTLEDVGTQLDVAGTLLGVLAMVLEFAGTRLDNVPTNELVEGREMPDVLGAQCFCTHWKYAAVLFEPWHVACTQRLTSVPGCARHSDSGCVTLDAVKQDCQHCGIGKEVFGAGDPVPAGGNGETPVPGKGGRGAVPSGDIIAEDVEITADDVDTIAEDADVDAEDVDAGTEELVDSGAEALTCPLPVAKVLFSPQNE